MASTPNWTLRPWKATIDEQMSSWMMYLPGVKNSNETKDIKTCKGV